MKVSIADMSINMELGSKGILLQVRDSNDEYLGDLQIGKGKLTWCSGRKHSKNGKTKTWKELITFFEG